MSSRLSKIRSVHTYAMHRTVFFWLDLYDLEALVVYVTEASAFHPVDIQFDHAFQSLENAL